MFSDAEFRVIAELIPHIAWLAAPDGVTEYFNRLGTEYTGSPAETNYGWNWVALVHPDDAARARSEWERAVRSETPYDLEYRIRRHDGVFLWHAFRALPVRGEAGQITKWLGTAVGIDERRRTGPPAEATAPADPGAVAGSSISVLLLESRPVLREGLRALLEREPDIGVTGEAGQVDEAVALEAEPDVIVTELVLREARGAPIVGRLRERFPRSSILVLTMWTEPGEVQAAFVAGANGYALKDAAARDVIDAIRRVHRGEEYVDPALGAALARHHRHEEGDPTFHLTDREREVLRLLALGHTNAELAERMSISLRTAESHRARLLNKLNVRGRSELVRCALERGLLGPADWPVPVSDVARLLTGDPMHE